MHELLVLVGMATDETEEGGAGRVQEVKVKVLKEQHTEHNLYVENEGTVVWYERHSGKFGHYS